jgi:hypothetical protein
MAKAFGDCRLPVTGLIGPSDSAWILTPDRKEEGPMSQWRHLLKRLWPVGFLVTSVGVILSRLLEMGF